MTDTVTLTISRDEAIVLHEWLARVVDDVASADNVVAMFWGAEDLTAGLGGTASRFGEGEADPGTYRDVARHARARIVHLSNRSAWAEIVETGHTRLCSLPVPAG